MNLPNDKFNPMSGVPTTDEEVCQYLRHGRDQLTGDALCAIYECRRNIGDDMITAYEHTLNRHITIVHGVKYEATR
jgi:hypothetical protein